MIEKFQILFLEEAAEFLDNLDERAREKIYYNIQKVRYSNNKELFKKLKNEIWEFRTLFNNIQYRLLAFWDKIGDSETVVISTHGIIKKTRKTPQKEIEKAEDLRKLYFKQKSKV